MSVYIKWKTGVSAVSADCVETHWERESDVHYDSLQAIFVPLRLCLTGLDFLRCHTKNTPLIRLAPRHMHSDPSLLVPVSANSELGQGMPIQVPKSHFPLLFLHPQTGTNSKSKSCGCHEPLHHFSWEPPPLPPVLAVCLCSMLI